MKVAKSTIFLIAGYSINVIRISVSALVDNYNLKILGTLLKYILDSIK